MKVNKRMITIITKRNKDILFTSLFLNKLVFYVTEMKSIIYDNFSYFGKYEKEKLLKMNICIIY